MLLEYEPTSRLKVVDFCLLWKSLITVLRNDLLLSYFLRWSLCKYRNNFAISLVVALFWKGKKLFLEQFSKDKGTSRNRGEKVTILHGGYERRSIFRNQLKSKMELFAKIINDFQPITIFAKSCIIDVWVGSECAFVAWQCFILFILLFL